MPTFSTAKLPRSASAEEFENMCADVLHIKYNCHFEKYGRRGQKQNGIDLVGLSEQRSCVVVQCKNYSGRMYKKLKTQLEKDIAAAGNLPFDIKEFVVMTALDTDVEVQNYNETKKSAISGIKQVKCRSNRRIIDPPTPFFTLNHDYQGRLIRHLLSVHPWDDSPEESPVFSNAPYKLLGCFQ